MALLISPNTMQECRCNVMSCTFLREVKIQTLLKSPIFFKLVTKFKIF